MDSRKRAEFARLLEISNELERLPEHERLSYIETATDADSPLRTLALRLLNTPELGAALIGTDALLPIIDQMTTPQTIGPYTVRRRLGAGAMGEVFLARKSNADYEHDVAVKLLPALNQSLSLRDQFKSERKILASLRHPNIAQMYDGGETSEGTPYIVMEYVSGSTLDAMLEKGQLSLREKLKCFEEVCEAIAYAHSQSIFHRDISSKNVIVDNKKSARVLDFGISFNDKTESMGGTASDWAKKDVEDLGRLLGLLLQGEKPSRGEDLSAISVKACSNDPYNSARELLDDIRAYQSGRTVAARPSSVFLRAKRGLQRNHTTAILIALLAVSIAAGLILFGASVSTQNSLAASAQENLQRARDISVSLIDGSNKSDLSGMLPTEARLLMVQRAIAVLEELEGDDPSPETRLEIIRGYIRLADATGLGGASNNGQRQKASDLLARAREMMANIAPDVQTWELAKSIRLELLVTSARDEIFLLDDSRSATDLVSRAERLFLQLAEPDKRDKLNLAHGKMSMARANYYSENPETSIKSALEAVRILESLAEQHPSDEPIMLAHSEANSHVGQAISWARYYAEQPYDDALPYYAHGINIAQKAILSESMEARRALALALLRRANTTCYMDPHRSQGIHDLITAETQTKALELVDPNNAQFEEIETNRLLQLADCYNQERDFDLAKEAALRAVTRQRETLLRDPSSPARVNRVLHAETVLRWIQNEAGDAAERCATAARISSLWNTYHQLAEAELLESWSESQLENEKIVALCLERDSANPTILID